MIGLLVALYFALKKEVCNCVGAKKEEEDEQHLTNHCSIMHHQKETDNPIERDATDHVQSLEEFYGDDDFNVDDIIVREDKDSQSNPEVFTSEKVELAEISNNPTEESETIEEDKNEDDLHDDELNPSKAKITKSLFVAYKNKSILPSWNSHKKLYRPKSVIKSGNDTQCLVLGSSGSECKQPLIQDYTDDGEKCSSSLGDYPSSSNKVNAMAKEISLSGRLQVSTKYDDAETVLKIGVRQGSELVLKGEGKMYWQVHIALLPHKKHRFKTRFKKSSTPIFMDVFAVRDIPRQILEQIGIRFRIYGKIGKTGRKVPYGEIILNLDCVDCFNENYISWLAVATVGCFERDGAET